jgi:hypothetical protein
MESMRQYTKKAQRTCCGRIIDNGDNGSALIWLAFEILYILIAQTIDLVAINKSYTDRLPINKKNSFYKN